MNKLHYEQMLANNRALSFMVGDKLGGFVTFYITDNPEPYINADPWDVLADNSDGRICYINQLITDENTSKTHFLKGWKQFKVFIKRTFKNVKQIHWRRWDKDKNIVKEYTKEL